MAITFTINIERNPNAITDVRVQILTEDGLQLATEADYSIVAEF